MDELIKASSNGQIIGSFGNKPSFGSYETPWHELTLAQQQTRIQLTGHMRNVEVNRWQLAEKIINRGFTFSTWHTGGAQCKVKFVNRNGKLVPHDRCHYNLHRANANFWAGQVIPLDLDKLESEDQFYNHPIVKQWVGISYRTPSHKPEKPRLRGLMLLDEPVYDGPLYRKICIAVQWLLDGLEPDKSCTDFCRLLFGCKDSNPKVSSRVLPLKVVMGWVDEYDRAHPKPEIPIGPGLLFTQNSKISSSDERRRNAFANAVLRQACDRISQAEEGDRHFTLVSQATYVAHYVNGGVIDRQLAYDSLLSVYPAYYRGDGPAVIEWAFVTAEPEGLPPSRFAPRLDFQPKNAAQLDFSVKSTARLNFNKGGN